MNYFTIFPLSGHWCKYLGLAVSTFALLLLTINYISGPIPLPAIFHADSQTTTLLYVFCIGLFLITFSKEKIDDERVQKIRYTAQRAMAFFYFMALTIIFSPFASKSGVVSNEVQNDDTSLILMLFVLPLMGYQLIFNLGLYLNPGWAFNDLGVEENIRKHPKFFLIYITVATIILIAFLVSKNK